MLMTRLCRFALPLLIASLAGCAAHDDLATSPAFEPGFVSMFDGKTLGGWRGPPEYFTVRDGAIIGGSDAEIPHDTFLIYQQPYPDFELRYRYRWKTSGGNSGIQFRSGIGEGYFAMAGLQANVTPIIARTERFGMLYEERGDRAEMVLLGQRAVITRRAAGRGGQGRVVRTVLGTVNSREAILASIRPYPEWNEGVLIAVGNRIVHVINGLVAFDATDNDPLGGSPQALLGLQVHGGEPMSVEYKDLMIRPLTSLPDLGRYVVNPGPAPEPARTYKDSTRVGLPDVPLP